MNYLLLFLIFVIFSFFTYKIFNDYFSPSLLYSLAMLFGIFCSIIGRLFWNNISNLNFKSVSLIIISFISFFFGELIIRIAFKKEIFKKEYKNTKIFNDFYVPNWLVIIEMIFIVITIFLLYFEVKRVASIAGYSNGSIPEMIDKFRSLSILNTTEIIKNGQGINVYISQMRKVCETFCFVNIFFVCKNIVNYEKKYMNFYFHIVSIFLCFIISLLMSERMQIAIYLLSFIFMIMIIFLNKMSLKTFIKKYFKNIATFCIISLLSFCLIVPLLGRKIDNNIPSYLSYYFGIEFPSLHIYMNQSNDSSKYFGQETLRGIYNVGFKLKLTDKIEPISTQWIDFEYHNNVYRSNIYTSGKRYFHDFGWIGIIICQLIFSACFTTIYLKIFDYNNPTLFIFYSSYIYMVFDQIRDDLFYSNFVHFNSIFRIIIVFMFFYFLKLINNRNVEKKSDGI